jgi:hypothetical protein
LARWKSGEPAFAIDEDNFRYDFGKGAQDAYNKEAIRFFVHQFTRKLTDQVNPHYASYEFPNQWKEASYVRKAIKQHVQYARDKWREAEMIISEERKLQVLERKAHRSRQFTVGTPSFGGRSLLTVLIAACQTQKDSELLQRSSRQF